MEGIEVPSHEVLSLYPTQVQTYQHNNMVNIVSNALEDVFKKYEAKGSRQSNLPLLKAQSLHQIVGQNPFQRVSKSTVESVHQKPLPSIELVKGASCSTTTTNPAIAKRNLESISKIDIETLENKIKVLEKQISTINSKRDQPAPSNHSKPGRAQNWSSSDEKHAFHFTA